jgi:hypothetical protein
MPWRPKGERKYTYTTLDLGTRLRWGFINFRFMLKEENFGTASVGSLAVPTGQESLFLEIEHPAVQSVCRSQ